MCCKGSPSRRRATARATPTAEIARRVAALGLTGRYYSPAAHAASFAVPAYIERLMQG